MTAAEEEINDDHFDDAVDSCIQDCLDLDNPKSFFLFAGAGSGKTATLVKAINLCATKYARRLLLGGQKVAVITYTNAACDEIRQRTEYNPLVHISTIHSFAWTLIGGFDSDIRNWLRQKLRSDLVDLEADQLKGKASSQASLDRASSIKKKQKRLQQLDSIRSFSYSPTGDNRTRDSVNHTEVIAMCADFIISKEGLQRLLIAGFPILLIDESQDTVKPLMDAFLHLQKKYPKVFCLGLIGDTMQRIYADGKHDLANAIPNTWAKPKKVMNHRSSSRIISLINQIRAQDDAQVQRGRKDRGTGLVRLFAISEKTNDKHKAELEICARMAAITGDELWSNEDEVKTLILEHHMAASRFGFQNFFEPLYPVDTLQTGLLDGTLRGVTLFTREILPLLKALSNKDEFAVASVVKRSSPLLDFNTLQAANHDQIEQIRKANFAVEKLNALCKDSDPTLLEILKCIAETKLFVVPDTLAPFISKELNDEKARSSLNDVDAPGELSAWRDALKSKFSEVERYDYYVRGLSKFDTHQGVKGLEFPRVLVAMSDEETKGFLFSFEKLFGLKQKTKTDLENEAGGKDTATKRTRRLFYVTCSRAKESLAVVYYSSTPKEVLRYAIDRGWFTHDEVVLVP